MAERIVAVGLLTERDVHALGTGFRRVYPVEQLGGFVQLLEAIDRADEELSKSPERRH